MPLKFIVAASVVFLGLALAPAAHAGARYDITCGILPGDGAYSYVRASNTTCQKGRKATSKARKKFCKARDNCSIDQTGDFSDIYRGTVRRNGWKCKVAVGWEYSRVKCRKGNMRVLAQAAS